MVDAIEQRDLERSLLLIIVTGTCTLYVLYILVSFSLFSPLLDQKYPPLYLTLGLVVTYL